MAKQLASVDLLQSVKVREGCGKGNMKGNFIIVELVHSVKDTGIVT